MKFILITCFGLLFLPICAKAEPVTFSAQDLLAVEGVTLPNGNPDSVGSRTITFNRPNDLAVLVSIPLASVVENPLDFTVSINLTRLTSDFDPRFFISDGQNLIGAAFQDHDGGRITAAIASLTADGRTVFGNTPGQLLGLNLGFPPVGGAFNAILNFQTTGIDTVFSAELFGGGGVSTFNQTFNLANGLSLLLVSSNNSTAASPFGENYRYNALTFDSTPVPAPPMILLTLLGVAFIGARRRI